MQPVFTEFPLLSRIILKTKFYPNLMSNQHSPTGLASRERLDQAIELLKELEEIDTCALEKRVERTIIRKERRRRKLKLSWSIGMAAVSLTAIAGVLLHLTHTPATTIISKIDDNITLSLSDGSTITLDDHVRDTLVTELDYVEVKMESGKLVYTSNSDVPHNTNGMIHSKLAVPRGSRFDIVLSDGTHVWLNSDSHLCFPSVFPENERKVTLSGEAYFEVAANPEKPFVIETPTQTLTVLGTKFNVNAYPNDRVVYTTLISGKVSLRSLKTNAEIKLTPNQQAILDAYGDFSLKSVDSADFILWKNGLFVFEGNTMEQIMQKLARWYNIDYSFKDKAAGLLVARGCVPIQDDITAILNILEKTGPLKFDITDNHIRINLNQ